jgi:hypothetical protein
VSVSVPDPKICDRYAAVMTFGGRISLPLRRSTNAELVAIKRGKLRRRHRTKLGRLSRSNSHKPNSNNSRNQTARRKRIAHLA